MKKWLVILTLALLLTGCGKKQETDGQEESLKQTSVESIVNSTEETETLKESVAQTGESSDVIEESKEQAEESIESAVESEESSEEVVEETLSQDGLEKVEFYFPNSNVEEIPEALLEGMSADSLRIARNEIYARHGRIFKNEILNSYFRNCSWYTPSVAAEAFDENVLNAVEKANVRKIESAESKAQRAKEVPITDRVTVIGDRDSDEMFFAYIENGYLLYYRSDHCQLCTYSTFKNRFQIFKGLKDIRRIKTFHAGTGVEPTPCLITEAGEVYWVCNTKAGSEKELSVERFKLLADYQVEDILEHEGERKHLWKVLLKDGRVISVESEPMDGEGLSEEQLPVEEQKQTEEQSSEVVPDSEEMKAEYFYFPMSGVEEIPAESLVGMSAEELRIARGEIYARHGYDFDDNILFYHFYKYSWYQSLLHSRDFDEKKLNAVERRNIEKLKAAEARVRLASEVSASDLVTMVCDGYGDTIFYAYIEDGSMYYYRKDKCGIITWSDGNESMEKYEGIKNIKRVKTFNCGSGVDPTPCLITEDGEVYWLNNTYIGYGEDMSLDKFSLLEDYLVEDILSFEGEWQYRLEVLLKDGRIINIESESWG